MSLRSTVCVVAGSILSLVAAPTAARASCIPGFDFAAFSDSPLVIGGGAVTDSYDSSLGTYAATLVNSGGDVCTNSTGADAVKFNGSGTQVYGNVCVGTGGSVPSNINASPGQYLSSTVLPTPLVLTPVTVPVVGTYQGNKNYTSPAVIPPNQTYGDVSINDIVTFNAGTYVMKSLSVGNTGTLNVGTGPVVIYITQATGAVVDVKGVITNPGLAATDLSIMVASAGPCTVGVNGGGTAAFSLYAPGCNVTVNGGGTIYGAIVGKDVKITGSASIHYDAALKNLGFGAFACVVQEVSRASPIIATLSTFDVIVQGTYEYPLKNRKAITAVADVPGFRFPYIQGHLRASKLAQFSSTAVAFTARTGSNELFDAKTLLPAANMASCTPFNSTCRSVFTSAVGSINPVHFNNTNANTIGALITAGLAGFTATEWATIVSRIVAGDDSSGSYLPKLGGLDRSTVAVIPKSLTSGSSTRPTMIYVGGTDGMLHAFCGSVQAGICDVVGRELWAYVPRVLLQRLRDNLAIIDGSSRVIDGYGDFDGDGIKSFSTILVFTTGTGDRTVDRTPAVYGLDITNPAAPKIIWEHTMTSVAGTAGTFQLGLGQTITAGPVKLGGAQKLAAFVQTNNGAALKTSAGVVGGGSAGSMVTALNLETGAVLWTQTYTYPTPRVGTNGPVPMQGLPGGAVAVDLTGAGTLTHVVFGTLYGDLWVLDAATGISKYGTGPAYSPVFRLLNDFEPIGSPPAIYSNGGSIYAVVTTGAYWDRSSAGQWNTSSFQWIFAAKLKTTSTPIPLDELDAPSADVPFAISFSGSEKSSAQALVVGTEIVFLTDTGNINSSSYGTGASTGAAHKINLSGANTGSDTLVIAGVGAVTASGTNLYASSGKGTEQLTFAAGSTTGETVNGSLGPKVSRRLWLRTL